jgi:hypothetical protein
VKIIYLFRSEGESRDFLSFLVSWDLGSMLRSSLLLDSLSFPSRSLSLSLSRPSRSLSLYYLSLSRLSSCRSRSSDFFELCLVSFSYMVRDSCTWMIFSRS